MKEQVKKKQQTKSIKQTVKLQNTEYTNQLFRTYFFMEQRFWETTQLDRQRLDTVKTRLSKKQL